tara:strand:- start:34 stop:168 length:135 start_codon:yes stop_codon:yes gene_type:complete
VASPKGKDVSPLRAKVIMMVFGIGPLILMAIFLLSNGFFTPPNL